MERQTKNKGFGFFFAYPLAVAAGLAACHLPASLWIFSTSQDLAAKMRALASLGFTAVPNEKIWPLLDSFPVAFKSAFFFTLSLGAGLSLLFGFLAWLLLGKSPHRLSGARLAIYAAPAILLLAGLNYKGIVLYPSLFVVFVALAVGLVSGLSARRGRERTSGLTALLFFAPIIVSAALWVSVTATLGKQLFDSLRDDVLLRNPIGVAVNNWYYRYTLYAAEPFKNMGQQKLKTAVLSDSIDGSVKKSITRALATADYVVLKGEGPVDLVLTREGDKLVFSQSRGKPVVDMPIKEFVQKPLPSMGKYHHALDRHGFFRALTLSCLILGFPMILYYFIFGALARLGSFVLGQKLSLVAAGLAILAFNMLLWMPLYRSVSAMKNHGDPETLLASEDPALRIAGIRNAIQQRKKVCGLPAFQKLLNQGDIAERRWAVKALGILPCPEAESMLTALLSDENPNVVCLSMHSLKRKGAGERLQVILDILRNSPHWYVQWYAYQAAKGMGWNPEPEKTLAP